MPCTVAARQTISIDDFMTGLIAGLARLGVEVVSIRGAFYSAVETAFKRFNAEATAGDCEVDFVVRMDPVHGDSPTIRMAITHAVQRDLVSLDNPVYLDMRIKVKPCFSDEYLISLPGQSSWYRDAAEAFLDEFSRRARS